jgi:hypothetical protein
MAGDAALSNLRGSNASSSLITSRPSFFDRRTTFDACRFSRE